MTIGTRTLKIISAQISPYEPWGQGIAVREMINGVESGDLYLYLNSDQNMIVKNGDIVEFEVTAIIKEHHLIGGFILSINK